MKAIIKESNVSNGKNLSGDKELTQSYNVIARTKPTEDNPSGMTELITVRCWMSRSANASTVYATMWLHGGFYNSGHGKASGYGYHRASAAINDAIRSAGIELQGEPYKFDNKGGKPCGIGGCGDSAVEEALRAIAHAMGHNGKRVLIVRN